MSSPHENAPLADRRLDYQAPPMDVGDLDPDPIEQFRIWFREAEAAGLLEPNAMTLATVDAEGAPNARIVLLKGIEADGFVFYTNYDSVKGRELAVRPEACLVFFWDRLHRAVRIRGAVERIPRERSEAYFVSRPRGSQLGAIASEQSAELASREDLVRQFEQTAARYADRDVLPCPEHWGGYLLRPRAIELWQGQPSRMHDRLKYLRRPDGAWRIVRLAP